MEQCAGCPEFADAGRLCEDCGISLNVLCSDSAMERIKRSGLKRFNERYKPLGATGGRVRSGFRGFFCHIHTSKLEIKVEYDAKEWDSNSERIFF